MTGKKDKLDKFAREVFDDYIGYTPTSSGTKPVHIANGLFRLILEKNYDIEDLNKWVVRSSGGKEVNSAGKIKEEFREIINEVDNISDEELNTLRLYLRKLFNPDSSAYASLPNTVINIVSKRQVRGSVPSESSMHSFLYDILTEKSFGDKSNCIDMIKNCLDSEDDEYSMIAEPIVKYYTKEVKNASNKKKLQDKKIKNGKTELKIRHALETLTKNCMFLKEDKLITLQRVVLISCFLIIFHLISKILDINSNYSIDDNVPIVFDSKADLSAIKYASAESLVIAKQRVEEYFEFGLKQIFDIRGYNTYSHDQLIDLINGMDLQVKKGMDSNARNNMYLSIYMGFYEDIKDHYKSFIEATRFMLFTSDFTSPADFISSFGLKIGLIGPQNTKRKRFTPVPFFLETLLMTVIDAEMYEEITVNEFGERLWNNFGIIVGYNPEEDYNRLVKWNISNNAPGDLIGQFVENAEIITDIFMSMGYGKKYADGLNTIFIKER